MRLGWGSANHVSALSAASGEALLEGSTRGGCKDGERRWDLFPPVWLLRASGAQCHHSSKAPCPSQEQFILIAPNEARL